MRRFLALLDKEWRDQRSLIIAILVAAGVGAVASRRGSDPVRVADEAAVMTLLIAFGATLAISADICGSEFRARRVDTLVTLPTSLVTVWFAKFALVALTITGATAITACGHLLLLRASGDAPLAVAYLEMTAELGVYITLCLALASLIMWVSTYTRNSVLAVIIGMIAATVFGALLGGTFDLGANAPIAGRATLLHFRETTAERYAAVAAITLAAGVFSASAFATTHRLGRARSIPLTVVIGIVTLLGTGAVAWRVVDPMDMRPGTTSLTLTDLGVSPTQRHLVVRVQRAGGYERSALWLIDTSSGATTVLPGRNIASFRYNGSEQLEYSSTGLNLWSPGEAVDHDHWTVDLASGNVVSRARAPALSNAAGHYWASMGRGWGELQLRDRGARAELRRVGSTRTVSLNIEAYAWPHSLAKEGHVVYVDLDGALVLLNIDNGESRALLPAPADEAARPSIVSSTNSGDELLLELHDGYASLDATDASIMPIEGSSAWTDVEHLETARAVLYAVPDDGVWIHDLVESTDTKLAPKGKESTSGLPPHMNHHGPLRFHESDSGWWLVDAASRRAFEIPESNGAEVSWLDHSRGTRAFQILHRTRTKSYLPGRRVFLAKPSAPPSEVAWLPPWLIPFAWAGGVHLTLGPVADDGFRFVMDGGSTRDTWRLRSWHQVNLHEPDGTYVRTLVDLRPEQDR